ncbi:thiamine biosynthesis protein ThiS [Burkholderia multivorans]|nr:thiamine biosynthesis protein ThiS [Burkholderia multivorans]
MTITLNGECSELASGTTARSLVEHVTGRQLATDGTPVDGGRLGVALAVDGEVIRRGLWAEFAIVDGQTVDIVTAVQGG